jgi:flagellar biosynthesis/type III secretory pathway M-ring protein FliF/YscJ
MITALLLAAPLSPSPTPSPSPTADLTPSQAAAPGIWAFVAFLFLAISLWLLMRNMNARLRRMSYKQKAAEQENAGQDAPREGGPGARDTRDEDGSADAGRGQTLS